MRSSRLLLLALIAGVAVLAGIWIAGSSGDAEQPAAGGRYVEGMAGKPERVHPLYAGLNRVDQTLVSLIFAGLTRLDDEGRAQPDLAANWIASDDGLTYTFLLRSGLIWPDGRPLTAEDVVFTYNLLEQFESPAPPADQLPPAGAAFATGDRSTVIVTLTEPFAPLPAYMTLGIMPRHLSAGSEAEAPRPADDKLPVGAGPFVLESLDDSRALLRANPAYHLGAPYLEEVELRFLADEALLLQQLKAGVLDGALFASGLAEGDVLDLTAAGSVVQRLPTREAALVFLNLERPVLADLRVRQALYYALDRDQLSDVVYGGAARLDSPLGPGIWSSTNALSRYRTDLAAADLLLEEAGWRFENGKRVRQGEMLQLTFATDRDPVRLALAQSITDSWSDIGVEVALESTGGTALVREILEPRLFDAVLLRIKLEPDPDPYVFWHSSGALAAGANPAPAGGSLFDALIDAGRAASSPGERTVIYRDFQEAFAQVLPSLPLYAQTVHYAQAGELRGTQLGLLTNLGSRFWQVHEWYIQTR